jgi:hypothetical protein
MRSRNCSSILDEPEEADTADTAEAEEGADDDMRWVLSGAYAETAFSARRRMAFRVAATALR